MIDSLLDSISRSPAIQVAGKVTRIVGLIVEGACPGATIGAMCDVLPLHGGDPVPAEVVGFDGGNALLMPLGEVRGLGPGSRILVRGTDALLPVGTGLLGRVLDGLGRPLDGMPAPETELEMELYGAPPDPMARQRIDTPMDLGIRVLDGALTCGVGQRMGIMAGSGVGKSTLLGMIARNTRADINVIGLIGERGREVREFIEQDLGPEGLARSVLVVATSDKSPLLRMRGAFVTTAIAEYFAAQGRDVLLMMDSVTRFAMAMREVGLAVGEPPTTKGYTPSVFAQLPRLLERAGRFKAGGSITGLYTVLVEGDDMNEPIADAVRSILDGHIVLSRGLAARNHYPCVDVLHSSSRVMNHVVDEDHKRLGGKLREILATYKEAEDLINIGAYKSGANPAIDRAVARIDAVNGFLRQGVGESSTREETLAGMKAAVGD
jgi:flagellum-specific ATP synthase